MKQGVQQQISETKQEQMGNDSNNNDDDHGHDNYNDNYNHTNRPVLSKLLWDICKTKKSLTIHGHTMDMKQNYEDGEENDDEYGNYYNDKDEIGWILPNNILNLIPSNSIFKMRINTGAMMGWNITEWNNKQNDTRGTTLIANVSHVDSCLEFVAPKN